MPISVPASCDLRHNLLHMKKVWLFSFQQNESRPNELNQRRIRSVLYFKKFEFLKIAKNKTGGSYNGPV